MFDYGWYSWGLNPEDEPEHEYLVSYEDIGGLRAKLLLPVKSPSGAAADHPPAIGVYSQNLGGASFNLIGRGLTPDQQRVAVGIFRSVRVLEQARGCQPCGQPSLSPNTSIQGIR